jgi:methyltransferase (TIGR00027 family)
MSTDGIEAVFLETHNWGKAAKFFQQLGYEVEFATDHNSGQLRRGDSPSLFISEIPESEPTRRHVVLAVADADAFELDASVEVVNEWEDTHWGTRLMTVRDPDGREWMLQAPREMSQATATPDSTAVRTALWRALHLEVDASPHVIEDRIGLQLAAPGEDWRQRPDMNEYATPGVRASIVARARFMDDLVAEQAGRGVGQYVLLGAGLDTFAQRRPEIASGITVFEVDQPGPQEWKRQRLDELRLGVAPWLRLVPVDFETTSWWDGLLANGFDPAKPAIVSSLGVSMYLTREATSATLRQSAELAPGSTLAMTFMKPVELVEPEEQDMLRATDAAARASGTPFISYYAPEDILAMAREAGFASARHVTAADYTQRYFAGRADGLRPFTTEEMLVATP